jgi:hypothetical protein
MRSRFLVAAILFGAVLVLAASCPSTDPSPQVNLSPVASFTRTPSSGDSPLEVGFDATASTDPDGSIVSYQWSFGDGGSASGVTATHIYTATTTRSFTATLTVTDNGGKTGSTSRTVTVSAGSAPPAPCNCAGPDLNCADFSTHVAAQACFDYCRQRGYGDVFRLDGDNDGSACESLP